VKYAKVEIRKGYEQRLEETDPTESLKDLNIEDFPIEIRFLKAESQPSIDFVILDTILLVTTNGFEDKKSNELHEIIQETFGLVEPTEEDVRGFVSLPSLNELLWKVYDKIDQISKRLDITQKELSRKMRCFVSFKFDDHSKALAFELKEFMELVGLQFVSGLGFEPRSVSEKVLDRLSEPLDVFIVILSSSGDSSWLNQEIGVARGRNLPILVLKEESSDAELGILGDTEYLLFPEHNISKAFVGILQALTYLRRLDKT